MRLIILAVLLSSCSMIHKVSNKQMKDSTAVITDNSKQYVQTDSTVTSKNIETADLVVVLKDTATGFVVLAGETMQIPAASIKEIRQKKSKKSEQQTILSKDLAIINDTRNTVSVKEKKITKDKHVYRIPWLWLLVIIPILLLYRFRGRIYEFFKAFTI
jgi:hypothetical protein